MAGRPALARSNAGAPRGLRSPRAAPRPARTPGSCRRRRRRTRRPSVSALHERVADLVDGADERHTRRQRVVCADAEAGREAVGEPASVVGDRGEEVADLQLELVEATAGALADPGDLLAGLVGERRLHRVVGDRAGPQVRVDPDDVGLATGETEQPFAAAADEDRRVRAAAPASGSRCRSGSCSSDRCG